MQTDNCLRLEYAFRKQLNISENCLSLSKQVNIVFGTFGLYFSFCNSLYMSHYIFISSDFPKQIAQDLM